MTHYISNSKTTHLLLQLNFTCGSSIYKKHCLGYATQKDRKIACLKKSLLESSTSQAPLIQKQE